MSEDRYRWDFGEQRAADAEHDRCRRRCGAVRFAWTMALCFAVCFALLCGVLILNPNEATEMDDTLTTEEIATVVDRQTSGTLNGQTIRQAMLPPMFR